MNAPTVRILNGHVLDHLRELPDASVHCVVTSPPYWGLRDYSRCECVAAPLKQDDENRRMAGFNERWRQTGEPSPAPIPRGEPDPACPKCHGTGKDASLDVVWDAKEGCEHEWEEPIERQDKGGLVSPGRRQHLEELGKRLGTGGGIKQSNPILYERHSGDSGSLCHLCGAWHGQLGLEPTPELYVQHIIQVFREVKRVLRDDGTLWLNMGDCYAGSWGAQSREGPVGGISDTQIESHPHGTRTGSLERTPGLKPKDLIGMPWRVAFTLQADGWYLRSDIIWAKPNPMPESVTDRPTKAHEYVFLLSKSARYFYDADAVRENWAESTLERALHHYSNPVDNPEYTGKQDEDYKKYPIAGSLITPKGAQRELDRLRTPERMGHGPGWRERPDRTVGRNLRTVWTIPTQPYPEAHFATFPEALAERCIKAGCPKDGTVLDPFGGSGTTGAVARGLGRSCILIEIKSQYVDLAKARVRADLQPLEGYV